MIRSFPFLIAALWPLQATTEELRIVTDVAPVHSLVAQVSAGAATPTVLVSGGASPHSFQFTFDQASALQDANLVIWAGPQLTPWLEDALANVAGDAAQLALLNTESWPHLDRREDTAFGEDDDHDHDHDHSSEIDPHAWLDPMIAAAWVDEIASTLATADPANAATYAANAEATKARLNALGNEITSRLAAVQPAPYLVPHDAYQYFETRYGLPAAGAISLSDAAAPSPAKIAELQAMVRDNGITCVLNDPQSRSTWVDLVREGSDAKTAMADPMGGAFPLGGDHYASTLLAIADAYVACLGE